MAKKKAAKELKVIDQSKTTEEATLEEVQQHHSDSDKWLSTLRDDWDDKESMLIVNLQDGASGGTSSKIYDPRLSTIVFERAARVMAQNPKGKAYAVSKDDIGKNILMNLLLDHYRKNANEQFSHLIKLRLWDLYSQVYGSMFSLVPWRVNPRKDYIGPELLILPIRDCFPQPGVKSIGDADWFTVRTVTDIGWLERQDPAIWKNVNEVKAMSKAAKEAKENKKTSTTAQDSKLSSFVERTYFPSNYADTVYPKIELYTEYRSNMWITWTPNLLDEKTGKPYIVRTVENPYPNGMLPIVAKHNFPLLDSPIGLGEFERGKSLQFGLNSLINLYMDGVKYSIFPPLHIDPNNVVPSSIKWGAGERWYMNTPNRDVQPMNLTPQGLQTFQSTYNFMLTALYDQAGTTSTTRTSDIGPSLGRTPEALKQTAAKESARDEWDRFMMEESIKEVYERWIALTVDKQETEVEMRLFGKEIKEIQAQYPDVGELFKSGERGSVKISKKNLATKYDYELEAGSTMKKDVEAEYSQLTAVLKAVIDNPAIVQSIQSKQKDIDIGELFKRWLVAGGVKDWDKIIIDKPLVKTDAQVDENGNPIVNPNADPNAVVDPNNPAPVVDPNAPAPVVTAEMTGQNPVVPAEAQVEVPEVQDPEIQAAIQKVFGGVAGIPPTGVA